MNPGNWNILVPGGKESKKGGGEEGNEESNEEGSEEDNSESNFSPEEQQIKPFFEIGFLFNASEGLNIKLLSDDDVGKTTENAAEEEQENEDKKEEKRMRDGKKPHTKTQEA